MASAIPDSSHHHKIRALFDEYIELYASRDERLTTLFSEDFSGYTVGGRALVKDRDEWIRIIRQGELATDYEQSFAHAKMIAERIRDRLSDIYQLNVTREGEVESIIEHRCSASIGVFVFLGDEVHVGDILKCADGAMYEAKAEGRNRVRFHEAKE